MAKQHQYNFYECDNPTCGLRFPGYDNSLRWNHCPICRSNIRIVAHVEYSPDEAREDSNHGDWQIDALLDNIRSAWNVGSIFRTSDGTGIRKIYIGGISPTPENPKVVKTSLGAESNVLWEKSNNAMKTAAYLKSQGHELWALEDLPDAMPLFQVSTATKHPILLIVGNEVSGIDPGIIGLCDKVLSIPMIGKKRSYNVAIAFSMAVSFLFYRLNTNARGFPTNPSIYSQVPD